MAGLDTRVGQGEVVAALGLEHRPFAQHFCEAGRPGAGRNDEPVRRHRALSGADRRRPAVGEIEAGDAQRQ